MFTVTVVPSEMAERDLEWDAFGRNIDSFMDLMQVPGEVSTEKVSQTLKLLETKILNHKVTTPLCQKVTNNIINYLRIMKPEGELEEMCTAVLIAVGSCYPGMVTIQLWDKFHKLSLPPRSLLMAVGKLSFGQGMATYIGSTWECILRLLRKAERENEMLAMCEVLSSLATSARKHLDLRHENESVMDISPESLSIKACQTLRVLCHRWPLKRNSEVTKQALVVIGHLFFLMPSPKLKNQVNWLTRRLMALTEAKLEPFYISQCIYKLLDALAVSGSGGVNLTSQLENIVDMLFKQVSEKVNNSDPHAVQNYSFTLKAFQTLTKLYNEQMVLLLRKALESMDPSKVASALQVFKYVFLEVSQTEKVKSEVMNSVIIVIQEDFELVRMALLYFIETMAQCGYLKLPQGNVIITYLIKLIELNSSAERSQITEEIQMMCSKILQTVSLPQLINLMCHPSNESAFVPLSNIVTEMALKAQSWGQFPYLANFHVRPTQFISPQKLLNYLVLHSVKPYEKKGLGESSLRLLHALHPITSMHPVIHGSVGQLWMEEIPKMLHILDGHNEDSLNQKEWEARLLRFLSRSLTAINDDNWLEQLVRDILDRINYTSNGDKIKAFLYKFFGFTLRTSRNPKLVKTMLSSILKTAHEDLPDREGIAVALSIVSLRHLVITLDKLQQYSSALTNKDTSSILKLMKEHQRREWGLVCDTIYLSYSKIILETQEPILTHLNDILTLVLQHYHNCIMEKDKDLKLDYLNSVDKLTHVLSYLPISWQYRLSVKIEFVFFMTALIKEEPLNSISSSIRQKAMNVITNFKHFKPFLQPEERLELLLTCYKSILSLPPTDVMQKEASNPKDAQASADLFRDTMQSLLSLMEALTVEMPQRIQNCLEFLATWLNSQKDHERERAMWCAARILGFVAKMNNFQMEIEFTRLGRLVRLLALRCQDPVDNICFLSSQAVYNLYCILLLRKKMGRKNQGLWEEEGKSKVYSASVFYNNTFEIAKAFAEYFTDLQLTTLVLTAIEGLSDSRAKVSLAAAQLMSAVMKKRGKDLTKVDEIVDGIFERLELQLEASTKEEVLRAMCSLAGSNTRIVVPMLLNKPLPWDRNNLALWKVFGTQQKTTLSVLQMLIGILESNQPKEEAKEMAFQPVAVTCALCEMLSGSQCQEAVQELYPRLLLAVLSHLYWVIEQNAPQKMVVYTRELAQGSKHKPFDPTSCALEAVKLVFLAAAYEKVVVCASQRRCWDLLSSPTFFHIGVMDLASGIVMNCELHILHRILNHVRNMLYSVDHHQKILARAFCAQLLWHRSVAQTLGNDFLGNLISWLKEPNLIMKEVGLRGISNLALHPGQLEALKDLVPFLRKFLMDEARVTVQAVKSLRNIIYHGQGDDTKLVFCSISKQLRPLINDERDEVRISATSALGHMLHRVNKFKPASSTRKEIFTFLVPLLLSIQDNNAEVVKACGGALTEWTHVTGWTSLTQMFQHTSLSDHIQVLEGTCKYLVDTGRKDFIGELLTQSFVFLKSTQSFLREAAVVFIGLITKRLTISNLHEDDVVTLQNALSSVKNDSVQIIQSLANSVLKQMNTHAIPKVSRTFTLSRLSTSILKASGIKDETKKKRLFKVSKKEEDSDSMLRKKGWGWVRDNLSSLSSPYSRRVKSTPVEISNSYETSATEKTQQDILFD